MVQLLVLFIQWQICFVVCRAIGLPCRSVTNFSSAHDTDGSTSIDRAFKKEGEEWVKIDMPDSNDSIW
jgi:transglutaminase 1